VQQSRAIAALLAVVGSGIGIVAAATHSTAAKPRHLKIWNLRKHTTSSTRWVAVVPTSDLPQPGYEAFVVGSTGWFTVTLNGRIDGAPAQFRLVEDGKVRNTPIAVASRPHDHAVSYTFYGSGKAAVCGHQIWFEWRSPSGQRTEFSHAYAVVEYKQQPPDPPGSPVC